MSKKSPQLELLEKQNKAYGGELRKTRKGRRSGRPLSVRDTMHLVLRSSKAKGDWSFRSPKNEAEIKRILKKFSGKYGVKILSLANVGNHLHFQIKLSNRHVWRPFIRAITAAIAMAVTGKNRWRQENRGRFWDYRPFTRVVRSWQACLMLKDYIKINRLEGQGYTKHIARWIARNGFLPEAANST